MSYPTELNQDVLNALGAPFPEGEVDFLPRGNSGGQAVALPYIDARSVMRRLDDVVGPGGWSFDFDLLAGDGKMVKGRLTVLGVTKCDAGEAGPEDEPLKSAVSDALKRVAVHFAVGRYLYHLPKVYAAFDAQKRRFTERPRFDPAAIRKALQLAGITADVPDFRPPAPRQAAPESRGDARAQKALEAQERRLPIAGAPVAEGDLKALKDECRALYVRLKGGDDKDARLAYYSQLLNLRPGEAVTPAEWEKLRDLLTEQMTQAAGTLVEAGVEAPDPARFTH